MSGHDIRSLNKAQRRREQRRVTTATWCTASPTGSKSTGFSLVGQWRQHAHGWVAAGEQRKFKLSEIVDSSETFRSSVVKWNACVCPEGWRERKRRFSSRIGGSWISTRKYFWWFLLALTVGKTNWCLMIYWNHSVTVATIMLLVENNQLGNPEPLLIKTRQKWILGERGLKLYWNRCTNIAEYLDKTCLKRFRIIFVIIYLYL